MPRYRSKTNTKFFMDIPRKEKSPNEQALDMLIKKNKLKEQRTELVEQARAIRKKMTAYSMAINQLEAALDKILLEKVLKSE